MSTALAIDGGTPVRAAMLPYGRQCVSDEDIAAITKVLKSDFLTTGPEVQAFEKAFGDMLGVTHAVAVNNGTTALHTALYGIGIGPGDEVIVPVITFAATANAVLMQGGTPVFVDTDPNTLLIDPEDTARKCTKKTKAIFAVDYAGQMCDYAALRKLCDEKKVILIADSCHAVGASQNGKPAGTVADLSCFSFHPVKPITTGEGGMIVTENKEWADRMRRFRNHNLSLDAGERNERGSWFYGIEELGYNYRLTDIQCALGRSQLKYIDAWTKRRNEIAAKYNEAFLRMPGIRPLVTHPGNTHAYHLYVIRWTKKAFSVDRNTIFKALQAEGIGVNLHYIPVHLHALYQKKFGTKPGMCPNAEEAYEEMLTLPLFSSMTDKDADDVIEAVRKVHTAYTQ